MGGRGWEIVSAGCGNAKEPALGFPSGWRADLGEDLAKTKIDRRIF
jgi:hypothetical protein